MTVPQPRSHISPHQPSDTRTWHYYIHNHQILKFLQTSRTITHSVWHSMYPESQPTSKHHSWRRTISCWGATARTLRALRPIITPPVLAFIMDQHSQVGLVGRRDSSPDSLIDLVELDRMPVLGKRHGNDIVVHDPRDFSNLKFNSG